MKTHHLPVYILCAGEASRFGKEHHVIKQLLSCAHGETFIHRIVRQVEARGGTPVVVSHHPEIRQWFSVWNTFIPVKHGCVTETLSCCPIHQDHTIVLLGDVCYSRDLMDRIFHYSGPLAFWGNRWEIYALRVRSDMVMFLGECIQQVLRGPRDDPGYGKLRRLWQSCNNLPLGDAFLKSVIEYVGPEDYSTDIDTLEEYKEFRQHLYRVDDLPKTGRKA